MEAFIFLFVAVAAATGVGAFFFMSKSKTNRVQAPPPSQKGSGGIKPIKANVAKTAQLSALQKKLASAASAGKMIVPNTQEARAMVEGETNLENGNQPSAPQAKKISEPENAPQRPQPVTTELFSVEEIEAEIEKESVTSSARSDSEPALIMLVDDSKVVRVKTEKLLLNHKFKVITAVDGIDALTKLENAKPDLIITDIEMPNLDGFGLVRNLRNNLKTSDIPIIVMTSHVNLHLDIAATEGINGFLPKPFNDPDLIEQVSYLVS